MFRSSSSDLSPSISSSDLILHRPVLHRPRHQGAEGQGDRGHPIMAGQQTSPCWPQGQLSHQGDGWSSDGCDLQLGRAGWKEILQQGLEPGRMNYLYKNIDEILQ